MDHEYGPHSSGSAPTYGQRRLDESPLHLELNQLRAKLGPLNELSYLEVRAIKEKKNGIRTNCEGTSNPISDSD